MVILEILFSPVNVLKYNVFGINKTHKRKKQDEKQQALHERGSFCLYMGLLLGKNNIWPIQITKNK